MSLCAPLKWTWGSDVVGCRCRWPAIIRLLGQSMNHQALLNDGGMSLGQDGNDSEIQGDTYRNYRRTLKDKPHRCKGESSTADPLPTLDPRSASSITVKFS